MFYKLNTDKLETATNIDGPGFSLVELDKDSYTYPVEGWHWFADAETARVFFGLPVPVAALSPEDLYRQELDARHAARL